MKNKKSCVPKNIQIEQINIIKSKFRNKNINPNQVNENKVKYYEKQIIKLEVENEMYIKEIEELKSSLEELKFPEEWKIKLEFENGMYIKEIEELKCSLEELKSSLDKKQKRIDKYKIENIKLKHKNERYERYENIEGQSLFSKSCILQ
jgi:predicted RNase H-like nuclease (RuvC/YqgF family)